MPKNSGRMETPRVTVRLCSGLGNQLFQFACGLAEARNRGASLVFDTTWYTIVARIHRPIRRLRLQEFGLPVPESFHGWRRWIIGFAAAAFDRTGRGRTFLQRAGRMTVVQETQALRQQSLENWEDSQNIYLNGYWQTSDHFLAVKDELQRTIGSRPLISVGARNLMSRIARHKSGFIHIRRGDYATLVGEAGLLPVAYYRNAVEAVGGSGWHWFLFSEDEEWTRHNLRFLPSSELVSYDSKSRDIEDLLLMASCQAGIIANSSYSYWGGALGERAGRTVVAPDRYWNCANSDTRDWVLPEWRTVRGWPTKT